MLIRIPATLCGFCWLLTMIEAWAASGHGNGISRADFAVQGIKFFDATNFTEEGQQHLRRMWRYAAGFFASALLGVLLVAGYGAFAG